MWPAANVEAVCKVLASTDWPGLTGTEIGKLLAMLGVGVVSPAASKRDRLWAALMTKQRANQASNCIIRFITEAMVPGRFVQEPPRFGALRDALDEPLALMALSVSNEGRLTRAKGATTLDDVARLAGRLRTELNRRNVYAEVVRYCGSPSSGPHHPDRHPVLPARRPADHQSRQKKAVGPREKASRSAKPPAMINACPLRPNPASAADATAS